MRAALRHHIVKNTVPRAPNHLPDPPESRTPQLIPLALTTQHPTSATQAEPAGLRVLGKVCCDHLVCCCWVVPISGNEQRIASDTISELAGPANGLHHLPT